MRVARRVAALAPARRACYDVPVTRVAVAAALLVAVACRRDVDVYPPDVVANFVSTCTTRADATVCRCAIREIQRRFTLDEFRTFEARLSAGEMPKPLLDAVSGCRP